MDGELDGEARRLCDEGLSCDGKRQHEEQKESGDQAGLIEGARAEGGVDV